MLLKPEYGEELNSMAEAALQKGNISMTYYVDLGLIKNCSDEASCTDYEDGSTERFDCVFNLIVSSQDGFFTEAEFYQFVRGGGGEALFKAMYTKYKNTMDALIGAVFSYLDIDGDGKVSKGEDGLRDGVESVMSVSLSNELLKKEACHPRPTYDRPSCLPTEMACKGGSCCDVKTSTKGFACCGNGTKDEREYCPSSEATGGTILCNDNGCGVGYFGCVTHNGVKYSNTLCS